ncbi:MAG: hypothetical protein WA082_04830 [Candidatus Moraniibacteriota bacterium]
MPQTFYIENDEEIISVISRLRRSSSEQNFFVFPKRALVLQSIINLRLFQREAEKLGKKIVIVTQDDAGKALAEKAGLVAERYSDDFSRQTEHLTLTPETPSVSAPEPVVASLGTPQVKDIGSSDFYTPQTTPQFSPQAPAAILPQTLRVRNASPEKQTSLNSKQYMEAVTSQKPTTSPVSFRPQVQREAPVMPVVLAPNRPLPLNQPRETEQTLQNGREQRLRNFFSNGGVGVPEKMSAPQPMTAPAVQKTSVAFHKAGGIFLFLGGVSALSILGVMIFLFLPKAEVHIIPYRTVSSVDLQLEGKTTVDAGDDSTLPIRIVEKEQEVTLTVQATGTSLGTAQKARGTILISNTFSAEPQSLVATTRFESGDGKVFRLTEGVTVPGMTGGTAGTKEAVVVADQTGVEYNIAATTFTIPGFKGSPKYEKFAGKSTKAMSGGNNSSGANQTIITKNDLEKATQEAKEKGRQTYLDALTSELLPGEKILEENLDIVALKDETLPLSGTVATSFDYVNTFKIRGIVFSEDALKARILSGGEEAAGGIMFRPVSTVLSYGEGIPDYAAETMHFKVHATVTSESVIDREKFLAEILGKDGGGIDSTLNAFPEIKKVSINFKPQWFTSTVPSSKNRVTIFVEPGEE